MPVRPNHWPVLPVTSVQVYKQDVVIVRQGRPRVGVYPGRAEVKVFSRPSRRRLAFVASNTDIVFTSMLTLTYPRQYPNDGTDVKYNLKMFLKELRRRVPGVSLLWFLEFQKRGAPHIHIVIRGVRVYKSMQRWVSKTWYRICGTGDKRHLAAGTRLERVRSPNGARNYCVKYAHKMKQKSVPKNYRNVGRFWGHTRDVKPVMRCEAQCTNDDVLAALEKGQWTWQKGDVIRYRTLYGAAKALTIWMDGSKLVPSTSQNWHFGMPPHRRREDHGYQAARNAR